jgi:hypothetical protein
VLTNCAGVRQVDLDAWKGQPVAALETHPVFVTMRLVRTVASDGTELRNYVNGKNIASCDGDGTVYAGPVNMATYSTFTTCLSSFAACNNVFHIRNGRVESYTPIGSGGARCYTDEQLKPGFRGAVNVR